MLSSECLSVKFCALKYIILAIFNERDGKNSYLFPTGKVSRLLPEPWQSQATHLVRSQGQDTGHSVSFSSFFYCTRSQHLKTHPREPQICCKLHSNSTMKSSAYLLHKLEQEYTFSNQMPSAQISKGKNAFSLTFLSLISTVRRVLLVGKSEQPLKTCV